MIILTLLLIIPIFLADGLPLIRERNWPELIVFGSIIGLALFTVVGKAFGIPTFIEILIHWFAPLGKAFLKTL